MPRTPAFEQWAGDAMARRLIPAAVAAALVATLVALAVSKEDAERVTVGAQPAPASMRARYERAADIMLRRDRSVFLAEICAARSDRSVQPAQRPETGRRGAADPGELRDGYGVAVFSGEVARPGVPAQGGPQREHVTRVEPRRPGVAEAAERANELRGRGHGACVDDNQRERRAVGLEDRFGDVVRSVAAEVQQAPLVQVGWQAWRACMATRGFTFTSREEIVRTLASEREAIGYAAATPEEVAAQDAAVIALAERELAIAAADADCYASSVEQAEADAYEGALESLDAAQQEVIAEVEALAE